jgi:hypothetical protein
VLRPPVGQEGGTWVGYEVKAQHTCAGVWDVLRGIPAGDMQTKVLSLALDHVVKISKLPGYVLTPKDQAAARELLGAATAQLAGMDAWALVSFIRYAAAFKGCLPPAGLAAWQAALERPGVVRALSAQGVGNALLALGTLADSAPQLAAAVDGRLAGGLLRRAVGLASSGELPPRHAVEALYSAALLGLQPSTEEVGPLFSAIKRAADSLNFIGATQLLLGISRLMNTARRQQAQESSEAPPPDQNPYHLYYPGDEVMFQVLDRARQLGRGSLSTQAASQILGACGALRYLPVSAAREELLAGADPAVLGGSDSGCASDFSTSAGLAAMP